MTRIRRWGAPIALAVYVAALLVLLHALQALTPVSGIR